MKSSALTKMKVGKKGRIKEIIAAALMKDRLHSMGIYPGREIMKVSGFALKGPVMIRVGRGVFALGHNVAEKIVMEI